MGRSIRPSDIYSFGSILIAQHARDSSQGPTNHRTTHHAQLRGKHFHKTSCLLREPGSAQASNRLNHTWSHKEEGIGGRRQERGQEGGDRRGDRREETGEGTGGRRQERGQEGGDRREETGGRRQEGGDRREETGGRKQEGGDRKRVPEQILVKRKRRDVLNANDRISSATYKPAEKQPPFIIEIHATWLFLLCSPWPGARWAVDITLTAELTVVVQQHDCNRKGQM
ncbi:unnamed protein product [Boreogadus saida]